MAILLKKARGVDQPQIPKSESCTSDEIAALIDDIASLLPAAEKAQKRIKMLQVGLNPIQEKVKILTPLVTADPHRAPTETLTVGRQFRATVGKRVKLRTVRDVTRAIELLNAIKEGLAYAVVTVPLAKPDSFLTPEQVSEVLEIGWGDGSVAIMKKAASILPPRKAV